MAHGDYDDCERLNVMAAAEGSRLGDSNITLLARTQFFGMRWMQGRMGELAEEGAKPPPRMRTPAWPAGHAVGCAANRATRSRPGAGSSA